MNSERDSAPWASSYWAAWAVPEKTTDRHCPRCGSRLKEIRLEGGDGLITLDRCPKRHGIWFDRGEILAVVETFHDGEEGAVAELFSNLLRDEIGPSKKGG